MMIHGRSPRALKRFAPTASMRVTTVLTTTLVLATMLKKMSCRRTVKFCGVPRDAGGVDADATNLHHAVATNLHHADATNLHHAVATNPHHADAANPHHADAANPHHADATKGCRLLAKT